MVDSQIAQEATALWVELFDEPPPHADGASILRALVESLPAIDYTGFASNALAAAGVMTPRRG